MNIAKIKQIPLALIAEHLGGRHSHTDENGDLWYFSPFRPAEEKASFKINKKLNTWHDFNLSKTFAHQMQGSGGDNIALWCDYHLLDRRLGEPQALQGLEELNKQFALRGKQLQQEPTKDEAPVQNEAPQHKIIEIKHRIVHKGLKDELNRRRIFIELADRYLKEGRIVDNATGNICPCFLFENDKRGYEVEILNPSNNEFSKTHIGAQASSRHMASDEHSTADIFKDFWDFLSWQEINGYQKHVNHTYILNSASSINEVCEKVIAFKDAIQNVFVFMANDEAGQKAITTIADKLTEEEITVKSLEKLYSDREDLSDYWTNGPTLDEFKFDQ